LKELKKAGSGNRRPDTTRLALFVYSELKGSWKIKSQAFNVTPTTRALGIVVGFVEASSYPEGDAGFLDLLCVKYLQN
jgi:hypothetical protein